MKSMILVAAPATTATRAGCVETVSAPGPGNAIEADARAACVRALRNGTGYPDVSVLSPEFPEAGARVALQVGPTSTWEYWGHTNGPTDRIMSPTDEGAA